MRVAALALVVAIPACRDTIVVGELQEVVQLKAIPNRDLDLLFVVDNSGSMADQQAALAASFPRMIDVLGELDELPNLHIGVVTSDLGTSGLDGSPPAPAVGQPGAGVCSATGDDGVLQHANAPELAGSFIVDADDGAGGRMRNYTGELRDVFAHIATVGETGCGFEQHLAAMQRALANPANAGFVRPDANLAVIVIADEDDCSVLTPSFFTPDTSTLGPLQSFRCTTQGVHCDQPIDAVGDKTGCTPRADSAFVADVAPFADALVAVKGDPRRLLVAGIVGDPDPVAVAPRTINGELQTALVPSCTFTGASGPETADPAVRLSAFVDAFPGRSTLTSICSPDLSAPLATIGASAKQLLGDPCLDTTRLVDRSPDPGVQPACEVVDIRDSAPDDPVALPSCADTASDCYEMVDDPIACPATPDHLRIRFHRTTASEDTWTSVRCQLR